MVRITSVLALLLIAAAGPEAQSVRLAQSAPPRVDMNEALRQIVKMVEPVVPPEAAAAKIGGTVVTEAIIRVNGTVESVSVLAGPQALHKAAIDAVKQWAFKPFLRNGKPARVLALIDVTFPDPARDEAQRRNRAVFAAMDECRQQQRTPTGEAVCANAARLADEYEPRQLVARGSAHEGYGVALLFAGKPAAARQEFEIALKLRLQGDPDENDAGVAEILGFIAVSQMNLGEDAAADITLFRAESAFEGALKRVPALRDSYLPRFASVLQVHARLKRRMGQSDAAAALDRRAADLSSAAAPLPPSPPARNPPTLRVVSGMRCLCVPEIDDTQMKSALASVPAAYRPWLVEAQFVGQGFVFYGAAASTGPDYQIGPMAMSAMARGGPPSGAGDSKWLFGAMGSWIQMPAPPAGAALPTRNAPGWPVRVSWDLDQSPLTPADLASLLRFMRSESGRSAPADQPAIRPWPIAQISHRGSLDFAVVLVDPASDTGWPYLPRSPGLQTVTVRKTGSRWTVVRVE